MKIFVLEIIDNDAAGSSCWVDTQGYAVVADSEQAARAFVANMDDEVELYRKPYWLDSKSTSCEEVDLTDRTVRVIMSDNPTG